MYKCIGKTCPLTQKPCSTECAWLRLAAPNDWRCLIEYIATGKKPLNP